jgi:hypothetical protein
VRTQWVHLINDIEGFVRRAKVDDDAELLIDVAGKLCCHFVLSLASCPGQKGGHIKLSTISGGHISTIASILEYAGSVTTELMYHRHCLYLLNLR